MNRFVALISLCALTQVVGAHQRVYTEEHAKKVQRFQLYNECVGVAIGYSTNHDLAEGIPGDLQLGSLHQDVREKLGSASILRHENNLMTHAVRD